MYICSQKLKKMETKLTKENDEMFILFKKRFINRIQDDHGWAFDRQGQAIASSETELYEFFLKMKEVAINELKLEKQAK